jgi:hypothetical protein
MAGPRFALGQRATPGNEEEQRLRMGADRLYHVLLRIRQDAMNAKAGQVLHQMSVEEAAAAVVGPRRK